MNNLNSYLQYDLFEYCCNHHLRIILGLVNLNKDWYNILLNVLAKKQFSLEYIQNSKDRIRAPFLDHVKNSNYAKVQEILSKSFNLSITKALTIAAQNNDFQMVKLLVERSYNRNKHGDIFKAKPNIKQETLLAAVNNDNSKMFKYLFKYVKSTKLAKIIKAGNQELLVTAAKKSNYVITKLLLLNGAECVNIYCQNRPLWLAVKNNNLKIFKLMLKYFDLKYLDTDFTIVNNMFNWSAWYMLSNITLAIDKAFDDRNIKFLKLLVVKPYIVYENHIHPLSKAAATANIDIFNLFYHQYKDSLMVNNHEVLSAAVIGQNMEIINFILKQYSKEEDQSFKQAITRAFVYACGSQNMEIFNLFLKYQQQLKTDINYTEDYHLGYINRNDIHESPAILNAVKHQNLEIIKIVLAKKPDLNTFNLIKETINSKNMEIFNLLVEAGLRLNDRNKAYFHAICSSNYEVLEILIKMNIPFDENVKYLYLKMMIGSTNFEPKAESRDYQMAKYLIDTFNLDINRLDESTIAKYSKI